MQDRDIGISQIVRAAYSTRVLIILPLLAGFCIIEYYSQLYYLRYLSSLLLLFAILIFFSDFFNALLIYETGVFTKKFNMFFFPGTAVHELSHALAALLTGGKVTDISLFNFRSATMGHVKWINPSGYLSFPRGLIVALAPFFGAGIILVVLLFYSSGMNIFTDFQPSPGNLGESIMKGLKLPIDILVDIQTFNIYTALLRYLLFTVSTGAAPSSQDFNGLLANTVKHPVSFLLTMGIFYLISQLPLFLEIITRYIYVILILSISFLIWGSAILVYFHAFKGLKPYFLPIPILVFIACFCLFLPDGLYSSVIKAIAVSYVVAIIIRRFYYPHKKISLPLIP